MKHIVIFSHGFGTRKDDRGLFPDIIKNLDNIDPVMFDYNEIDEVKNTITIKPLGQQVDILKKTIEEVKLLNPDSIIDLICHSRGAVIAALLGPLGIRKIIFIAAPQEVNASHSLETAKNRPGSEINLEGISRLARQDGSTTIVPAQYWKEISNIPIDIYEKLSDITELNIIIPNQDEIVINADFSKLDKKAKIIKIDGDHGFSGASRKTLINTIKNILK